MKFKARWRDSQGRAFFYIVSYMRLYRKGGWQANMCGFINNNFNDDV